MKISWQHVVMVAVIVGGVVALALAGQDTTALIGLATLILAGIGLLAGQQQSIKEQTNGTQSELLRLVRDLSNKVAEMSPLPPAEPKADDETSNHFKDQL